MKKVYVVTSGSYSDYEIDAIFDNEEAANEYVATASRFNKYQNCNGVDEWDLNSTVPPHRVKYSVQVGVDGEVMYQTTNVEWSPEGEAQEKVSESYLAGVHETSFWATSYRGYEVALKAARDKLAQWKAEQTGL